MASTSCNKKKDCPEGFIRMDDKCICPAEKFEGQGMCRDLKPNEYWASLEHCPCKDTIFFEVLEHTDKLLRVRYDLGWGYREDVISLIDLPTGDSLYTERYSAPRFACPINGQPTYIHTFGRFIDNDRKIRVTFKYVGGPDLDDVLAECQFVLHQ